MSDEKILEQINRDLIDAENRGDHAWIAEHLAPTFAFQNAKKEVVDGLRFVQGLEPNGSRTIDREWPIQVIGDRAIVRAVIEKEGKKYDNLRLWVKREGAWKLLAWANEPG